METDQRQLWHHYSSSADFDYYLLYDTMIVWGKPEIPNYTLARQRTERRFQAFLWPPQFKLSCPCPWIFIASSRKFLTFIFSLSAVKFNIELHILRIFIHSSMLSCMVLWNINENFMNIIYYREFRKEVFPANPPPLTSTPPTISAWSEPEPYNAESNAKEMDDTELVWRKGARKQEKKREIMNSLQTKAKLRQQGV